MLLSFPGTLRSTVLGEYVRDHPGCDVGGLATAFDSDAQAMADLLCRFSRSERLLCVDGRWWPAEVAPAMARLGAAPADGLGVVRRGLHARRRGTTLGDYVRQHPGCDPSEIADVLGRDTPPVAEVLCRFSRSERLLCVDGRWWPSHDHPTVGRPLYQCCRDADPWTKHVCDWDAERKRRWPRLGWAYLRLQAQPYTWAGGRARYFFGAGPLHGHLRRWDLLELNAGRWLLQITTDRCPGQEDGVEPERVADLLRGGAELAPEPAHDEELSLVGMRHHELPVGPVAVVLHRRPDSCMPVVEGYGGRDGLVGVPRPQWAAGWWEFRRRSRLRLAAVMGLW